MNHVEQVMGTRVSFTVVDDEIDAARRDAVSAGPSLDAESGLDIGFASIHQAVRRACDWLHWVERTFSTFREDSEISRMQRGTLAAANAHPLVREVLDICDDLFIRSDGIFDPFARGRLDPAGVVKGWSIERAATILRDEGIKNFSINGGGDIVTCGVNNDGVNWTSGVRHPLKAGEIVKLISHSPSREAIATSGAYERGNHIVDTRDKRADNYSNACLSASVIGADLTWADSYATIVFILGVDGLDWLQAQGDGYDGYVVIDEHHARSTFTD